MSPGIGSASLMPVVTPDASSAGATAGASGGPGAGLAPGATAPGGAPLATVAPPTTDGQGAGPPTGGAPPTDAFASVLSSQVARTALAEGQSKQTSTKGGKRDSDASARGQDTADPTAGPDAAGTDPTSLVAAVLTAVAPAAPQALPAQTAT
ncbi:MAG TPA: hypothetical protein VGF68_15615, partial [Solirubrobacteraceae bacterium]